MILGMSYGQLFFLALGFVMVATTLFTYFKPLKTNSQQTNQNSNGGCSLTDTVSKWENLFNACEQSGLSEACSKLKEVFPSLLSKNDK